MRKERTVWRRVGRLGTSLALAGAAVASAATLTATLAGAAQTANGTTTNLNVVYNVPVFGGYGQQALAITGNAPTTVTQGSTYTSTFTPAPTVVPNSEAVGSLTATVGSIQGITTLSVTMT